MVRRRSCAVARAAGLLAVAGLPAVVGLTSAAYHSPAAFGSSFKTAMIVCAALLAVGSALSALTIDNGVLRPASAFKRRKIRTPSGRTELRTVRPGFRDQLLRRDQARQQRAFSGLVELHDAALDDHAQNQKPEPID